MSIGFMASSGKARLYGGMDADERRSVMRLWRALGLS